MTYRTAHWEVMHGRKWDTGEATIVDIKPPPPNTDYGTTLVGRIRPHDGGEEFLVDIPCPLGSDEFVPPDRGDRVNVYYSRDEHDARIDTNDPRVRSSSQERRHRARNRRAIRSI